MELNGKLSSLPLADLLQLIESKGHTGRLHLKGTAGSAVLYFNEGRLIFSGRLMDPVQIGHRLALLGALPRRTLMSWQLAVRRGEKKDTLEFYPGPAIAVEKWKQAFELELEDETLGLFDWTEGDFEFESGSISLPEDLDLNLEVKDFLDLAKSRAEKWEHLRAILPKDNRVPAPLPLSEEEEVLPTAPVEENQWKVLAQVDGYRSSEALAALCQLSKFEICQALADLQEKKLIKWTQPIQPTGFKQNQEPTQVPQAKAGLLGFLGSKEKPSEKELPKSLVALLAEFENRLLEHLNAEAGDSFNTTEFLTKQWNDLLEEYPLSDLLWLNGNRIEGDRFEQEFTRWEDNESCEECLLDTLDALRTLLESTYNILNETLGEKRALALYHKEYEQIFPPEVSEEWLEPLSWLSLTR